MFFKQEKPQLMVLKETLVIKKNYFKKFQYFNSIPVGLFLSNIGGGGVVSQDIMRKQCCNSHVHRSTF